MDGRRVVVTGMGTVNPLGTSVAETWKNALSGASGIKHITAFDASHLPAQIAGEMTDFDPEAYVPRKDARRMDRNAQLFYASTEQALRDAGLEFDPESDEAQRAGVVFGSGIGGIITFQNELDVLRDRGPDRVSPLAITKIISNMAGGLVSIAFNLYGPNNCTVTACAASANAIGDAAEIIKRGDADVMVAGGAEAGIVEFSMAAFCQSRALSTHNSEPTKASRPFDRDRDGFVMGEGSATLILEELDHARARNAEVYAEVVGYGMSADGYHITLPRPGGAGASRAMTRALDNAGLNPEDLDYVNAHGTSTEANDATETAALKLALGDVAYRLPVSSTKSMTGHLLGGAGAVEALFSIMAIREGVVPPTINYETPDPECDLDYVPNEARRVNVQRVMSNSFGFGGHNVALIFSAM